MAPEETWCGSTVWKKSGIIPHNETITGLSLTVQTKIQNYLYSLKKKRNTAKMNQYHWLIITHTENLLLHVSINVNTSLTCLKVLGLMNVFGTFRLSRTIIFNNNNNIKKDDSSVRQHRGWCHVVNTPFLFTEYLALPFLYTILQHVHISKIIIL